MSRSAAVAMGIATFAAGLIIGLLCGRGQFDHPDSKGSLTQSEPHINGSSSGQVDVVRRHSEAKKEVVQLRRRIRDLENELERRAAGDQGGGEVAESRSFARRIYEEYLKVHKSQVIEPEAMRRLMTEILTLNAGSASYFIEEFHKLRAEEETYAEREVLLDLALASGGPDATEFINMLLNDPSMDSLLRANLLSKLSGTSGAFFSIRRLPVNSSLAATGMRLARGETPTERAGGAGLLGGVNTDMARDELRRLVTGDPASSVKVSAVLSLGHIGDASTKAFLQEFLEAGDEALDGKDGLRLRKTLQMALEMIEKRGQE